MAAWDDKPDLRESRGAKMALDDFLGLGPGRSLETLWDRYREAPRAPTRSLQTLRRWADRFNGQERAGCHDEVLHARAEREQHQAMHTGLVLPGARVECLKRLCADLIEYLRQAWPVWYQDLRAARADDPESSPTAEHSRAPRFNPSVIAQLRGLLDDLARETGGRAARVANPANALPNSDDDPQPDLSLLSQEDLDALGQILRRARPVGKPGMVSQPKLPGLRDRPLGA